MLLHITSFKLLCSTYERAIRAYLRAGFKEFGRRREVRRRGEKRFDVVYMDCLATEFRDSTLSHLLPL